ncbi:MAG: thiolase domain-containing protein [Dehalococcoidia bacterium]
MREVAVVGFAQAPNVRRDAFRNEVEIVMPVVREAMERSGLKKGEVGFTCSGSSDFLAGQPFAFVTTLDAVGPWPPIEESHVEMDGAWALYEAWVRLQHGDIDSALVYGFGKSSLGDVRDVMTMQLDPYCMQPLWPDSIAMAALQARAMLDAGACSERDMAGIAVRSRRDAKTNANAQLAGDFDADALLAAPCIASPLRKHDCAPITDGAAAVVLAAGDLARRISKRPAWIRGIDHRIEAHHPGMRDLTQSPSTALAAQEAGATGRAFDVAELYAPFTHQEIILRDAIGLNGATAINPSGGALAANPLMAAGLIRIGEAAQRIIDGDARSAVAHATSGPCLQQNLVCVLEAD